MLAAPSEVCFALLSPSFEASTLFASWLSAALSLGSSLVFRIETRLAFFLSATRGLSLLVSFMQNLSMHFLSDAGVDGAETVQKIELLDANMGSGSLIGGKFKCA